ncbi:MAG: cell division protein ZapA [Parasphingorhabdus sp.]
MGQMTLEIGGRSFSITCQDGEEAHLSKLGNMVSEKAAEAGESGGLTESRMLLFTSLLLADELHGHRSAASSAKTEQKAEVVDDVQQEQAISALEKLADRAEAVANSLE